MLTVAYCRVSTEEQAADGFSIDGQADRLRAYAELHDLGEVVVVSDPGWSGKNTDRPGLQRVLAMVEAGHLANVLVWRLDRLSRNLGDLILLADTFGQAGVSLHSFTERIDLSSATGRMFYNVLGSFAQFYREQLAENVTMGTERAMREGRWCNRPPTGYDLDDGLLIPNADAVRVRRVFTLRGQGHSISEIADTTLIGYSTVVSILRNRAYLGEMRHRDEWWPGRHEPIVTEAEWAAAHRGRTPGIRRGKDLMSGKVRCGTCGRKMSIDRNGQGNHYYRCKHRGQGCGQPARSNKGLLQAAALGLSLLCDDAIRDAIRRHLEALARTEPKAGRTSGPGAAERLRKAQDQRRKLLALHYDGHISAEQFGEEQARLTIEIETLEAAEAEAVIATLRSDDLLDRFDQLAQLLDQIQIMDLWANATETERRTLLDELVENVTVLPDHLVVEVHGAPPLRVAFAEVGLKESGSGGVGGGT